MCALSFSLLLLLCCSPFASAVPRKWVCRLGSRVMLPQVSSFLAYSVGTTFLVAGYQKSPTLRMFLTAQHALAQGTRPGDELFVYPPGVDDITQLPGNEKFGWHVESWLFDDQRDLAILYVAVPLGIFSEMDGFQIGNWEEVKLGDIAFAFGYAAGDSVLGKKSGTLIGTTFTFMNLDVPVPSGYSGGPLVLSSKRDAAVGVVIRDARDLSGNPISQSASVNSGIIASLQQEHSQHQQNISSWTKDEV